jgi:hypothetical protein
VFPSENAKYAPEFLRRALRSFHRLGTDCRRILTDNATALGLPPPSPHFSSPSRLAPGLGEALRSPAIPSRARQEAALRKTQSVPLFTSCLGPTASRLLKNPARHGRKSGGG